MNALWNTSEPPNDGTKIVAIGRVIWTDDFSTSVIPFVAAICWFKHESGFEGWHYDGEGMAVARALEDEVKVDYWAHFPKEGGAS